MKTITCILGSPRKNSNSAKIAELFCNKAKKLGAEVKIYNLNKLNYKGCQGRAFA
jgi:multimeric flavodoxin WrbA